MYPVGGVSSNIQSLETFYCLKCKYSTNLLSNYNKHKLTKKHNKIQSTDNRSLTCVCEEMFNSHTSLWRHKKVCKKINTRDNTQLNPDLLFELVKQNNEFKQLIIEQTQKITELVQRPTIINNIGDTNCNKSKFNLNIFLNEKCKDALNITEFVNSLKIQLSDLENTGKLGFVEGISQIFIKGLKELDIYKRPIHCSDYKRDIMYVKEENKWEKEETERDKTIQKAIHKIAHKNIQQIPVWMNENPDCGDYYSKKNTQYLNIIHESMGGSDEVQTKNYYNKIKKKVSKEVMIS